MIKQLIICFRKEERARDYWLPIFLESKKDDVYEYIKKIVSKKAFVNKGLATSYWRERKSLFKTLLEVSI